MRLGKAQSLLLFGKTAVDDAMMDWLAICDSVAWQMPTLLAHGEGYVAALFALLDTLMAGLDASFHIYKTEALQYQYSGRIAAAVLVAVLCLLIISLYRWIIAPSVQNMVACGQGTENLLRGLPEDMIRQVCHEAFWGHSLSFRRRRVCCGGRGCSLCVGGCVTFEACGIIGSGRTGCYSPHHKKHNPR